MSGDAGKYDAAAQVKEGNEAVYEELVLKNLNLTHAMAKKRCKPYLREDAAQEAAIKLWKVARRHDPEKASFSTYACTCISNKIMDIAKMERRRAQHFRPFDPDSQDPAYNSTPLDEIVKKEERTFNTQLYKSVQVLPLHERFVITFHHGLYGKEPRTLRTIGKMLKLPEGTVKTIERRAYKKLREQLASA